jgi:hypothetical protein
MFEYDNARTVRKGRVPCFSCLTALSRVTLSQQRAMLRSGCESDLTMNKVVQGPSVMVGQLTFNLNTLLISIEGFH